MLTPIFLREILGATFSALPRISPLTILWFVQVAIHSTEKVSLVVYTRKATGT
jgi:hypothetical protein